MLVTFGILGCGQIAQRHGQHIRQHPEAEVVAAYDPRAERTEALCARFGGQPARDLEAFLESGCQIVSICTPNGLHADGAIACLARGKHVLVEKPMAISQAQCEAILNASLRYDRRVFVVKQNRYNPPVQALRNLLAQGALGRVLAFQVNCFWNRAPDYYLSSDWKGRLALDGGTLYTQFSHFIDILYYLFGDVEVVAGTATNVAHQGLIEFEDTGFFTLRLREGAVGGFSYTTAAFGRNMEGSITVFGERGAIKVGGQYLNTIEYQRVDGIPPLELPASSSANDYGTYQGSMSNHDKVIHNVIQTLSGRESMMTNALEGMKVVEIIERMYRCVR